jgi:hypothetical protein
LAKCSRNLNDIISKELAIWKNLCQFHFQQANINSLLSNKLTGLKNKAEIKSSKSIFLTFDTLQNSVNALDKLKEMSNNTFLVKYSYYRIFFTMNGLYILFPIHVLSVEQSSDINNSKLTNVEFSILVIV